MHAADQYPAVGRAFEKGLPHGYRLFLILIEQNRRIWKRELDRHAVYQVADNQKDITAGPNFKGAMPGCVSRNGDRFDA